MAHVVTQTEAEWRACAREELLQLGDDLLYTEKTHFAAAETLHKFNRIFGLAATMLSTAAAGAIVADLSKVAAGLLALVAAIISGSLTFVKPEQLAAQHLATGRQLGALRVRARHVLTLDLARLPVRDLRKTLAEMVEEKAAIESSSPDRKSVV